MSLRHRTQQKHCSSWTNSTQSGERFIKEDKEIQTQLYKHVALNVGMGVEADEAREMECKNSRCNFIEKEVSK